MTYRDSTSGGGHISAGWVGQDWIADVKRNRVRYDAQPQTEEGASCASCPAIYRQAIRQVLDGEPATTRSRPDPATGLWSALTRAVLVLLVCAIGTPFIWRFEGDDGAVLIAVVASLL